MRQLTSDETKTLVGALILVIIITGIGSFSNGLIAGQKKGTTLTKTSTDFVVSGYSTVTSTSISTTTETGITNTYIYTTTTTTIAFIFTNDTVAQINQSVNLKCRTIANPNVDYYLNQIPGMNGLTLLFAKSFITKYVSFWTCI